MEIRYPHPAKWVPGSRILIDPEGYRMRFKRRNVCFWLLKPTFSATIDKGSPKCYEKKPQISNCIPLQYMFRPSGFDHMLNKTIFLDDIFDMFNEGKLCLHDFLSIHKKWKFEPLLFSLLLLALATRDMFLYFMLLLLLVW